MKLYRKRNASASCGEVISYFRGCRCFLCKKANAQYNKEHRKRRGKEYVRNCNLKHAYNLTIDAYNKLLIQQNNVCAACGEKETGQNQYGPVPLAVDHCHKTGQIRGLLCMRCNRALGLLKDNVTTIKQLFNYRSKF